MSASEQLRQIGLLVVLLSAMHSFSHERSLGTLAWLKSLKIPATRIVFSKWGHYSILAVIAIGLAQLSAAYYTIVLFDSFDVSDFLIATGLLMLHFVVQLSIFFMLAALLESGLVALVITLGLHFIMSLLLGWLEWDWMPWRLGSLSAEVLIGEATIVWSILSGIVLIGVTLFVASKRLLFMSHSS
jgi:ABC-2 type transport system permease protein